MFLKPTEEQRSILKRPLGKLLVGSKEDVANLLIDEVKELLACVGDFVSGTALDAGIKTLIYVVDSKTERSDIPLHPCLKSLRRFYLYNPPGVINVDAWRLFSELIAEGNVALVMVEGEEDLLTLPMIDVAPLESKILYGQPQEGAVVVNTSSVLKDRVRAMLKSMPIIDSP
jgi:uncharacterized protein (UPF0218 family)